MGPERWERLVSIFHELHEKSAADRIALLESTRSTDPDLAVELERMLREEDAADGFLGQSPVPSVGPGGRQISPGDVIAHYRILSLLGSGGMGIVYCARDTRLNRLVALKFLAPHLVGYGHDRDQFVREAQAAAALHHPNVCPVHEIDEIDGYIFIAMAFLEGESLAQKITAGPLAVKDAVGFALETAAGLQAAHAKGVIHHDIKPANLMVTAGSDLRSHITLMDFGLAQMTDRSRRTREGWLGGTISYMSPERVSGFPVDHRTDLWSLGVVLFEMLTGQKPFPGTVDRAVLNAIVHLEPASPSALRSDLPLELDQIIRKALAKEPDRRYAAATELIQDLRDVAMKLEAGGPIFPTPRRARPWVSLRSPALVIPAAVITVLFGWYAWKRFMPIKELVARQVTSQISDNRVTTAAISPDGKLLAYATVDGVFVQVMRTGEMHVLRSPKNFWVDRIRWIADGDKLVIGGFERKFLRPSAWTVSLPGAEPTLLRADARDPEPTQDGSRIAFTNGARSELWISGAGGEEARQVLAGAVDRVSVLFWSGDASHLAFARQHGRIEGDPTETYTAFVRPKVHPRYECIDVRTGQVRTQTADLRVTSAFALSQGRVVFLSPDPVQRGDSSALWQMETDFRTAMPQGTPHRLPLKSDWVRDVSASADGSRLTVVRLTSVPTVHVADWSASDLKVTNVRRLTLDASSNFPHGWTSDSLAVIFESNRRGTNDVFRQDVDIRIAETIIASPRTDFHANLSPDGHWYLFAQAPPGRMLPASIARLPVGGGTPEEVAASGSVDEFRCALPGGKRCVARRTEAEEWYRFYELDAVHGVGRELARTRWMPNVYGDWALSPQGTEVALPFHDPRLAKIRILSLDASAGPLESELAIEGLANISGLNWSADGKGWFVVITTTIGRQLMYVDRAGRATRLLDGAGYAVPSPDGKRVALMIPSVTTNVWSFEGF
jgi:serine/threonine protein kinase